MNEIILNSRTCKRLISAGQNRKASRLCLTQTCGDRSTARAVGGTDCKL